MGGAAAQSLPDEENGRYTLSPVADGVIRLDTRTGAVSTCSNTGAGWACHVVPDERAALDAEIGRLQGFTYVTARSSLVPTLSSMSLPTFAQGSIPRWGGSFPFPRREFHPLEASGLA